MTVAFAQARCVLSVATTWTSNVPVELPAVNVVVDPADGETVPRELTLTDQVNATPEGQEVPAHEAEARKACVAPGPRVTDPGVRETDASVGALVEMSMLAGGLDCAVEPPNDALTKT